MKLITHDNKEINNFHPYVSLEFGLDLEIFGKSVRSNKQSTLDSSIVVRKKSTGVKIREEQGMKIVDMNKTINTYLRIPQVCRFTNSQIRKNVSKAHPRVRCLLSPGRHIVAVLRGENVEGNL